MNINSVVEPALEWLFTFILATLIFVVARAIHSHWLKEYFITKRDKDFSKGKSEYEAPPRPHSKTFANYFQLALLSTPHRQRRLAKLISQLINEQLTINNNKSTTNMSESLQLLLRDPNSWIDTQYDQIGKMIRSDRRYTSDYLYEEFNLLLTEVEKIVDIPLVFDKE